jgi:gamma-glutamylcyclotransferase (GGCT)/AIG2-like uncharacterized protein YtfP
VSEVVKEFVYHKLLEQDTSDKGKYAYLFTYGRLQVHLQPPKNAEYVGDDAINADGWEWGSDVGATRIGNSPRILRGELLRVPRKELPGLDRVEGPQYRRIRTRTLIQKVDAEVYERVEKVPNSARRTTKWPQALRAGV